MTLFGTFFGMQFSHGRNQAAITGSTGTSGMKTSTSSAFITDSLPLGFSWPRNSGFRLRSVSAPLFTTSCFRRQNQSDLTVVSSGVTVWVVVVTGKRRSRGQSGVGFDKRWFASRQPW